MGLLGRALGFFVKGSFGLVGIYFLNQYVSSYGLQVGINFYNGAAIGLLGIPGFIMLYILVFIDKKIM